MQESDLNYVCACVCVCTYNPQVVLPVYSEHSSIHVIYSGTGIATDLHCIGGGDQGHVVVFSQGFQHFCNHFLLVGQN